MVRHDSHGSGYWAGHGRVYLHGHGFGITGSIGDGHGDGSGWTGEGVGSGDSIGDTINTGDGIGGGHWASCPYVTSLLIDDDPVTMAYQAVTMQTHREYHD